MHGEAVRRASGFVLVVKGRLIGRAADLTPATRSYAVRRSQWDGDSLLRATD